MQPRSRLAAILEGRVPPPMGVGNNPVVAGQPYQQQAPQPIFAPAPASTLIFRIWAEIELALERSRIGPAHGLRHYPAFIRSSPRAKSTFSIVANFHCNHPGVFMFTSMSIVGVLFALLISFRVIFPAFEAAPKGELGVTLLSILANGFLCPIISMMFSLPIVMTLPTIIIQILVNGPFLLFGFLLITTTTSLLCSVMPYCKA